MTGKKPRKNKKTPSKRTITMRRREAQSFTLRMAGENFQSIADIVGYADPSGAFRAFNRALDRLIIEEPNEMRLLELSRLDAVQIETYRQAEEGQLSAVDRLLKIQERRSKLMGLDTPVQVEVAGKDGGPVQVREVRIELSGDDV